MAQSPTPIHEAVREHYAERIKKSAPCCATESGCTPESELYPVGLLTTVPSDVAASTYGCGDPITLAALKPGQTVIDLGSGAGLDCLLASQKVGAAGRVIGVDMTPEMIERARANAKRINATNVEFRHGYLEDLPVEAGSADVVISNCVTNLSPDKAKVFAEIFRVLKAGGCLAVSDLVTDGELPAEVRASLSAWAGCVAGAVRAKEYISMMEAVGFKDISIQPVFFDAEIMDEVLGEIKLDLSAYSKEAVYKAVYSAKITARKN